MEVSCRVGIVSFSCEWRCLLSCLETVVCVIVLFFKFEHFFAFFLKTKTTFLQNYGKQETENGIK